MSEATRWCERCKAPIPTERVEALPETRVCVKCAQALGGSEFELTIVSENLAKIGSLKKNYGGISVQKRRKEIRPVD
jgi:RNA polymerase-binding transcription factor DksA